MRTYYRDFPGDLIERAWEYAAQQSSLGHNVRFVCSGEEPRRRYRVFFCAVQCDTQNAINVKDVPRS